MTRIFLLAVIVMSTGCHRFVPARAGQVAPGRHVRVHLTEEGARRVDSMYAAQESPLSGELESWGDRIVVAVPVPVAPGMLDRDLTNRIVIPGTDIVGIDMRERDQTRTLILAGGIAALVTGMAVAAFSGVFGGSQPNDPPVEEDSLVPLWLRVFP